MRILITGICGFVGSSCAIRLREMAQEFSIFGIDSLARPGAETNRAKLRAMDIGVIHGDIRLLSDVEQLPAADYVIDAAANPSVLAGVDGKSSPRQLVEHNLGGTVELLEYCRRHRAGLILLSSSRVYSIPRLSSLPMKPGATRFELDSSQPLPAGLSERGIDRSFSTAPPVSLYGSTKLASETLALEYASAFDLPLWINRCGLLAGAGQFGKPDQGILSFWIHSHRRRRPLRYVGFGGNGLQVRDALHPRDLAQILLRQIRSNARPQPEDCLGNYGGGIRNSFSLRELTAWCDDRFGVHAVATDPTPRAFDLPWVVMDAAGNPPLPAPANTMSETSTQEDLASIFEEIALHAEAHPHWLELCEAI